MENRTLLMMRLSTHVEELRSLTDGLTDEQLKKRPAQNRWSLHELAVHLAETQDIFIERLANLLVDDNPSITPFYPDQARKDGLYLRENLRQKLATFGEQRATLVKLLETLTDEQWRLEGTHPEFSHYTVEKCVESMMRHEEHHLYQMYNIFFGKEIDH